MEQTVDGAVTPVFPGHGHLEEVLGHGHGEPGLGEEAGGVCVGGGQRLRGGQV